jgi:hypothetical protein
MPISADLVHHHARHLVGRALVQADVTLGRPAQFRHRDTAARSGPWVWVVAIRERAAVLRAELLADAPSG